MNLSAFIGMLESAGYDRISSRGGFHGATQFSVNLLDDGIRFEQILTIGCGIDGAADRQAEFRFDKNGRFIRHAS